MSSSLQSSPQPSHGPLAGAPADLPVGLRDELRRAARELDLEGAVDLKPGAREGLRWRQADLEFALLPIGEDALDRILVSLSTMIAQAMPGVDGKLMLRLARHDLKPLPEFALRAAAADFRRGIAGDGKFRPTIAELSRLTRLKALRFREEAVQIGRVLAAKTRRRIDPAEKVRVAGAMQEYLREAEARAAERDLEDGLRKAPRTEPTLDEILADHARRGAISASEATRRAVKRLAADACALRPADAEGGQ